MNWLQLCKRMAQLVQFEHTIFALPFALSAMALASYYHAITWQTIGWVLVAMVGARTYAMAANRVLDASIDRLNPRTRNRDIPAGRVTPTQAWRLAALSAGLLVLAASQLPPICFKLLPVAFFLLTVYSLCKHFTVLSHWVLGLTLSCAVIGGWLAVAGTMSKTPVLLALAVLCWVSGFDLIYACQDADFDREYQLHSIPGRYGIPVALWLSRAMHGITLLLLGCLPYVEPAATGWIYTLGCVLVGVLLATEHWLVWPIGKGRKLENIPKAFFTLNGWISIAYGMCVIFNVFY